MNKWIAYAALAAAFLFVGAAPTHAAANEAPLPAQPMTLPLAKFLYAVAYGQYHGPPEWLQLMPDIQMMTREKLCASVKMPADCRAEGRYFEGKVYLLDTLDFADDFNQTVLVHEFFHHFQTLKSGAYNSCEDWLAREKEAYALHAVLLANKGLIDEAMDVRQRPRRWRCDTDQLQDTGSQQFERPDHAMGKAFRCEEEGRFAQQLMRDAEYQFPTINLLTYRDKLVLPWLKECVAEGKPIRECVTAKCTATGMDDVEPEEL